MIRLLIVDDHEVVRLGLRTLLESEPDLQVAAEAGTAQQALIQAESQRPDVVIMDIQLPGASGLEACREIRRKFPQIQVVMLTSSVNENFILEALHAGAAGYILKQVGNDELVRAIRAAHNGELALDPKTAARVVAHLNDLQNKTESDAFRDLSAREMEVLNLVARGQNNREIGQALHLSEITARNYVTALLEKLHLRNRVELAAYAIRNHIEERL